MDGPWCAPIVIIKKKMEVIENAWRTMVSMNELRENHGPYQTLRRFWNEWQATLSTPHVMGSMDSMP